MKIISPKIALFKTGIHLLSGLLMLLVNASDVIAAPKMATSKLVNRQIDANVEFSAFSVMLKKAEMMAQTTADQLFQQPDTGAVVINVSAEQSGQIIPILVLKVSRSNWQKQPYASVWARSTGGVKQLLGFNRSFPGAANAPVPAVAATPANPMGDRLTETESNFYNRR
jgi:hypothetical protein